MLNETVEKALRITLLVSTVIFAILSLIPPIRWIGAYALRSTSILFSANSCRGSWQSDSLWVRVFKCLNLAFIVLSLVALILNLPSFILAMMVLITSLQLFNFLKSLFDKEWKMASIQAGMFILDILMIAALVTGSWALIVSLSALSACFMLGIGIYLFCTTPKNDTLSLINTLYYFALCLVSVACAVSTAELWSYKPTTAHFDLNNSSNQDAAYYDKNGLLLVLAPGESKHLDLAYSDLDDIITSGAPGACVHTGVLMVGSGGYIEPNSIDVVDILCNPAISQEDFPTVPLVTLTPTRSYL